MPSFIFRLLLFILFAPLAVVAAPDWNAAHAVLSENCYECHNAKKTKGGVDLQSLEKAPDVEAQFDLWEKVQEVLAKGTMPPKDETQPTAGEKQKLTGWLNHELDVVANANAGDPGPVTLRRLTNAEYDCTIRDLTGNDYGLGREFLPDGGGGEGFTNIGDVLFTNPQQLDKYLAAARKLADYATILPGTGIVFHKQRIGLRGPEQMKAQGEQALYVWLQQKAAPYLPKNGEDLHEDDYMLACWKWKYKEQTGAASLEQLAKDGRLVQPFLENWWRVLNSTKPESRFLDLTRLPWRALPPPEAANPHALPAAVLAGVQAIQEQRRSWDNPKRPGNGVQRRQQDADGIRTNGDMNQTLGRQKEVYLCVGDTGDGAKGDIAMVTNIKLETDNGTLDYVDWLKQQPQQAGLFAKFGKHPQEGRTVDAKTLVLAAPIVCKLPVPEGASSIKATARLDMKNPDVDAATIQWRLGVGTPPDPDKIMPGVLTIFKRQTEAHHRLMRDFDVMKAAFPDVIERRLEQVAQNMYRSEPGPGVYYLSNEQLTELLTPAEQKQLEALRTDWGYVGPKTLNAKQAEGWDHAVRGQLKAFASLSWRRPLEQAEEEQVEALYRSGIDKGLDRETAAREVISRVLVSPNFVFKTETSPVVAGEPEKATGDHPVSAWELASRLSYFLWSSKPDEPLRNAAADDSLLKPEVREAQVRRMMRDPKAQAMAKEFMGQWLEFNGFENHTAVDAKKFPEFTPELRRDLYQETVTFFTNLIREDRPVREIVTADYTFLNERLAKLYGVPGVSGDQFQKVSVSAQHRGGLLGMGSVLTKTSRSHRTSPVLRGNWLLQSVLGTPVPPPPPNVPELKEHGPKPATVREMLEQHRADKACAACHDRIDPLGFALENFDAIGRFRDKDETGLPLDTSGTVKSGATFTGIEGLRDYLKTQDVPFTAHFARKLLGYSLGRQVLPTDKQLLTSITQKMTAGEGNFSTAVLAIVNSRQFLNRRY